MEKYIDGFVIPLSKRKLDEYKRIAEQAGAIWKEHGALEYPRMIFRQRAGNRLRFIDVRTNPS